MKIGIYDPYLDDLGGGEKYMMSLALCLAKDNTIDIFWDNPQDLDMLATRFNMNLSSFSIMPNVFSSKVSLLKRFLTTKKYDAIFFLSDGSIPLVGSKKLLIHFQQPLEMLQRNGILGKIKLRRVHAFFCNSEFTKSFIKKRFQLNTSLIYPPVAIHAKKMTKKNIILHVGRFRVKNVANGDFKKQNFMVDMFKHMVDEGLKGWEFILAVSIKPEDTVAFASLQQKTREYPIHFVINNSNAKLWDLYSQAKIYWHASGFGEDLIKHPEYAEHFGISTVEAMGSGVVPVVINAGGQKEIITNNENGLLWDTQEACEKQTKKVINDPVLWEKLSENARKRAKDFSPDSFCQKVKELMK